MEITSYRGKTVKRMTTHHDPRTNVVRALVIEFEEGDQLMLAVDTRRRGGKLELSFAPPGVELTWPPE